MSGADEGAGPERLAPVIPLFGDAAIARPSASSRTRPSGAGANAAAPRTPRERDHELGPGQREHGGSKTPEGADDWHRTWRDLPRREHRSPRAVREDTTERDPSGMHPAFSLRRVRGAESSASSGSHGAEAGTSARRALVRKLGGKALSVTESRAFLAAHIATLGDAENEPAAEAGEVVEEIVAEFEELGYLDDAALAEQIVHIGVTRKRQGRGAIARAITQRGIGREIADAAVAMIADDDDAERALAFARDRARSMRGLDEQTALRRLLGQLARRGFAGSVATAAARQALGEHD